MGSIYFIPFILMLPLLVACFIAITLRGLAGRSHRHRGRTSGMFLPCLCLLVIAALFLFGRHPGRLGRGWSRLVHRFARVERLPVAAVTAGRSALPQYTSALRDQARSIRESALNMVAAVEGTAFSDTDVLSDAPQAVLESHARGIPDANALAAPSPDRTVGATASDPDAVNVPFAPNRPTATWRTESTRLASILSMAVLLAAFLGVGYVFLDATTLGHHTWPLRIVSVLAFAGLCVAVSALRLHL